MSASSVHPLRRVIQIYAAGHPENVDWVKREIGSNGGTGEFLVCDRVQYADILVVSETMIVEVVAATRKKKDVVLLGWHHSKPERDPLIHVFVGHKINELQDLLRLIAQRQAR